MNSITKLVILAVTIFLTASSVLAQGLEITELDVSVDYDEAYTYRVEQRDRIDSASVPIANGSKINVDILPGSHVAFTIRVENTFSGEEPKLDGVFARLTIEEIDDGADLEFESLDFDLEPGDDYRFDIGFEVPLDVNSGTYKVIVEAESEDRNETPYDTEVDFKLDVKKQSHDIRITKAFLNPAIVDCNRKSKLTAEIANMGSNPENEIALELKVPNLGINSYEKDLSLESSDEASEDEKTYTRTITIEVPSFFSAGTYPVFVNLYWKNFVLFDKEELQLIVKDCRESTEDQNNQSEDKVVIEQPETQGQNESEGFQTVEGAPFFSSPLNIAAVAGGIAVLTIGILAALGYLKTRS